MVHPYGNNLFLSENETNKEIDCSILLEDTQIETSFDVSIYHIAFVTKTIQKMIILECVIVTQFLHHCHLFYPKYEEITAEDFSSHVQMLKDFEVFLEGYLRQCEKYLRIINDEEEKIFRKTILKPLREEFFHYWYRFYDITQRESYTYYLQYDNENFLILSEKAKESIELEMKYLDFIYKYILSEFSRIMDSLDTSTDSPLYSLHVVTISEDYRHWYADLSFFQDRQLSSLTILKTIITKSLLPKRSDYVAINENITKVVSYITKLKNTINDIYTFIDGHEEDENDHHD